MFFTRILFIPSGNQRSQVGPVIQKPIQSVHKIFLLQKNVIFQYFYCKQGNQSNH